MGNTPDDTMRDALEIYKTSLSSITEFQTDRDLDDVEHAAAYRLVLGINKWIMDSHFLNADRERPRFVKFMDEFAQWGLGNPDNVYWIAQINGDAPYIIAGKRGTTVDLCIELRTGIGRKESGEHSRTLGFLDVGNLVVEADGTYRVQIGGDATGPNHIPTHPDADIVLVRATFNDWDVEEAGALWIESAGPALEPASPLSSAQLAEQLSAAGRKLEFVTRINDAQVGEFRSKLLVNQFQPPNLGLAATKSASGAFPGQKNALAWWRLEPGKALIVSLTPPDCRYLGFSIGHPQWFTALDFENRQNSLNLHQSFVAKDGKVHFVIAAEDPGVANWIDPGHLQEGFMFVRCQGVRGEFEVPEVTLVHQDEIVSSLPQETPRIAPAERLEVLKRRRTGVNRRLL